MNRIAFMLLAVSLSLMGLSHFPAQASLAPGGQRAPIAYEWKKLLNEVAEYALLADGKQVGGYDATRELYRPLFPDGSWGEPCEPPCELPEGLPAQAPTYVGALPTGVDWNELNKTHTPRYVYKGKEISREKVLEILKRPVVGDKKIPDDAHKPWCVAIARSKSDRERISKDWTTAPELALYRDKFRFQCYDPADPLTGWPAADFKVDPATPLTVRLLDPKGQELSRQDYYNSPADLAEALKVAARKADPNYDPNKTPDLSKPPLIPGLDTFKNVPWSAWALGGAAGIFFLLGKSKLAGK